MVRLIGQKAMNRAAAYHSETKQAVKRTGQAVEAKAKANLAAARASTQWSKISGPSHLTSVSSSESGPDFLVHLNAPNAMAIEFGHAPSGFFAGTLTKAPHGLYILTMGAGLDGINLVPNA